MILLINYAVELFHNVSDEAFKRDCLFFIAIGQTRLKVSFNTDSFSCFIYYLRA